MSPDFKRAADCATALLLKQRPYSTRIDIKTLHHDKNIIFDSYSGFCRKTRATIDGLFSDGEVADGLTIRRMRGDEPLYIVLYNDKVRSKGRLRFTLAHELGHIYLGHMCDDACEESEANCFASHLLLPPVLVWELLQRSGCKLSPRELAGIFATSKPAAENALKSLTHRRAPVFSPDERRLLETAGGLLPEFEGPIVDF